MACHKAARTCEKFDGLVIEKRSVDKNTFSVILERKQ